MEGVISKKKDTADTVGTGLEWGLRNPTGSYCTLEYIFSTQEATTFFYGGQYNLHAPTIYHGIPIFNKTRN